MALERVSHFKYVIYFLNSSMASKKVRLIYNLLLAIKIHITTDNFDKNDNIVVNGFCKYDGNKWSSE